MRRLKQFFYVAHVHYNNFSCDAALAPFPSWAFEVLLVSKRIASSDGSAAPPAGALTRQTTRSDLIVRRLKGPYEAESEWSRAVPRVERRQRTVYCSGPRFVGRPSQLGCRRSAAGPHLPCDDL